MTKTKFTSDQKIQTVLESISTNIHTAELCGKYNVYPYTFQAWALLQMNQMIKRGIPTTQSLRFQVARSSPRRGRKYKFRICSMFARAPEHARSHPCCSSKIGVYFDCLCSSAQAGVRSLNYS